MRILVPLLPGLGDALTASPILRAAIESGAELDILTMLEPVAEYARALEGVRDVIHIPLLEAKVRDVLCALSLRHRNYDLLVLPFPATRWQYAALARAMSPTRLVMHNYGGLSELLARNANAALVALRGGHRIWENQRLAFAANLPAADNMRYLVPSSWKTKATPRALLGVHAGSMTYKGNEARRWPFDKFLTVIRDQMQRGRRVRLFIGPQEHSHAQYIREQSGLKDLEVITLSLPQAAVKLSECKVFLSNDSGLGHLASGIGVQTIVIFGMTDPIRAAPVGPSLFLRPSACPPCFDEGLRSFSCARKINFKCINDDVPIEHVIDALDRAFLDGIMPLIPSKDGSFHLYGSFHTRHPAET